jgi:type IV pilus assembly protein PilW
VKHRIVRHRLAPAPYRHQRGISIVEVMVAMTVGLILIAGVGQIYLSGKQTYRMQEAQSRLQESARFALEILTNDIRKAGFMGCISRVQNVNNTLNGPPPSFDPGDGIQGWEANGTGYGTAVAIVANAGPVTTAAGWTGAGGNILDATMAVPGSDIVRIWHGDDSAVVINGITPGASTVVNTGPNSGTSDGDILLISDCQAADWIQACNVQAIGGGASINHVLSAGCVPGNIPAAALKTKVPGELVKLVSNLYYIGKRSNSAANEPALFVRPLSATAAPGAGQELVEGVENLQILYGEDTDSASGPNRYVAANDVGDWTKVVSVRVSLLMRTMEDNLTDAPQNYNFNGVAAVAPDRRLRRVFTTTIGLRNRLQ